MIHYISFLYYVCLRYRSIFRLHVALVNIFSIFKILRHQFCDTAMVRNNKMPVMQSDIIMIYVLLKMFSFSIMLWSYLPLCRHFLCGEFLDNFCFLKSLQTSTKMSNLSYLKRSFHSFCIKKDSIIIHIEMLKKVFLV